MNKGLEALYRMIYNGYVHPGCKELKIIEEELKEHEQYKDIEEELGIDLVTLINALKNGIYVNINYIDFGTTNNFLAPDNIDYFDINLKQITTAIYFKDYGKTWALTKEELEGTGMKLIRTKDGIFEVEKKERAYFEGQPWLYYCKRKYDVVEEKDILKQADTIEELCDEFYIDYGQERFPYSTYRQYERYAGLGDLIRYLREINFTGYDSVYGYIWVILPNNAPILKPVTKMKGILPDGKIDWELL